MRVAILSDIHGNFYALLRVLNDAAQERVDQVWFLGDIAGYGPDDLACYEELKNLQARWHIQMGAWLVGNHDLGLIGHIPLGPPYFSELAAWSQRRTQELAAQEDRDVQFDEMCAELSKLPSHGSPEIGIWLVHSGADVNEQGWMESNTWYIMHESQDQWKAEQTWEALARRAVDEAHRPSIILSGHTHVPLLWRRCDDGSWLMDPAPARGLSPPSGWGEGRTCPRCGITGCCSSGRRWADPIVLPSTPVLINPGSVGSPRDDCPAAAYAILDFRGGRPTVTFRRVGYNVEAAQWALTAFAKKHDGNYDRVALEGHVRTLQRYLERGTWQ